jgi:ubiquinone/menaquinone biosynthesis C-methylase UbiE
LSSRVDYDQRQHTVYAQGRALSEQMLATWMDAFARHAPPQRPLTVLDLGSGTGRFTPALADTFGGPVYGVEPSTQMRAVAEETARHSGVAYLAGGAERIPLPDSSCDLVLMFLSLHHVQDRGAAAAEIARVLRPAGRLLIRSTFSDRMPDLLWHRYFARARAIEERLFPSMQEVVDLFGTVGLRQLALDQVRQRFAPSLAEYADRLRLRAISTFELMTNDEIEAGLAALDADAAAERTPQPVEEDSDLLVLAERVGSSKLDV